MTPEEFKEIRLSLGKTQAEMGAMLGRTRHTVSFYELGASPIPVAVAIAVRSLASQGETGNG